MRRDLALISRWIRPGSRVLDLGCGDGTLLRHLQDQQVEGYGLEIDATNIRRCIDKGINVIHFDVDKGLQDFSLSAFDYVIMTQSIQAMHAPDMLIREMLRVGREVILSFPNMGHWRCRLYLALKGHMPVNKALPHQWYDTPNIHLCTVRDFQQLCRRENYLVRDSIVIDGHRHRERAWPVRLANLFGEVAIYRLQKGHIQQKKSGGDG